MQERQVEKQDTVYAIFPFCILKIASILMHSVNIEFCEPAYTRSFLIAEFWNSISSLVYLFPGLIHHGKVNAIAATKGHSISPLSLRRVKFATASWVLLALGSFAFHASQTAWGEFVDEVGMISVSCSMCYAIRDKHQVTRGMNGCIFYTFFFGVVLVLMLAYLCCGYHPFFASVFILTSLVSVMLLKTMPLKALDSESCIHKGIIYAIVGYCIWHIDQLCVARKWSAPNTAYEWELHYWSHPVWHVLTAAAGHSFLSAITSYHFNAFECREEVENDMLTIVRKSKITSDKFDSLDY